MNITLQRLPTRGSATFCGSEASAGSQVDLKTDLATEPTSKQSAESFARRFTHFEWQYLCSYRLFLEDVARAIKTNDFSAIQIKAENALVRAGLRRPTWTMRDELSVCHSPKWYD